MRRLAKAKSQREPTIALINIVFLMLVFFMVAGTLSPPMDTALSLVQTNDLDGRAPPDTLVIHADGRLNFRGDDQPDIATYMANIPKDEHTIIRVVPDRDLDAMTLVKLTAELRANGAQKVMIVTQKALE